MSPSRSSGGERGRSALTGRFVDEDDLRRAGAEAHLDRVRLRWEATKDGWRTTRHGRLLVWLVERLGGRRG